MEKRVLSDSEIEKLHEKTLELFENIARVKDSECQRRYRLAKSLIPGGTQLLSKRPEMFAPDQWPAYYREAHGCEVVDLDGRHYVDMSYMGIGACLLGYNDPDVTDAVVARVKAGSMCTLNSPEEVELAQLLLAIHPWADEGALCADRGRGDGDRGPHCAGQHGPRRGRLLRLPRLARLVSGGQPHDAVRRRCASGTPLAGPVAQRRADATGRHGLALQLQPARFVGRDRASSTGADWRPS